MCVGPAHTANLSRPGTRLEPKLGANSSAWKKQVGSGRLKTALTGCSDQAGGRIHSETTLDDLLPLPLSQGQTRLSERHLLGAAVVSPR